MMRLKKRLAALSVVCLLAGLTAIAPASARLAAQDKDEKAKKEKKDKGDKKAKKDKGDADQSPTVSDRELRNVLWTEPTDIESRDLFNGAGGAEGAPATNGRFTFEKRVSSGTSEKIHVSDDKGRKWTVKFGPEAKPETAASRIVWAAGY